jgi:drug/metabolite transporter (DMT)-like permease
VPESESRAAVQPQVFTAPVTHELRAAMFMLSGACLLASHFAIIKYLTAELPQPVIALWRGVFASLLFMPRVYRDGIAVIATARPVGHLWRSLFGFTSFLAFVYALSVMPLGDAVAISFTSPFWSVILGVLVFHDRMTWRLALAVIVGFSGVILIAQPGGGGTIFGPGAAFALSSAIIGSFGMMALKQLTKSEPADRIAFYFMAGSGLFALPISLFDWAWPTLTQWSLLLACSVLFFFGQIFMARAYAFGTFSRVAPFDLTRLPVSILIGILWFAEVPDATAIGGMLLIAAASIDLLLQSRKKSA